MSVLCRTNTVVTVKIFLVTDLFFQSAIHKNMQTEKREVVLLNRFSTNAI